MAFLDRVTREPQLQERIRSSYASGGDRLVATLEIAQELGLTFSAQEFLDSLEARYSRPPQAGDAAGAESELSEGELESVAGGALTSTFVYTASTGVTIAFPDVCKTPAPGGPVPIPYPISSDPTKLRG
jgi:hypothetical protein